MAQIIALFLQLLIPITGAIIKKWLSSEAQKKEWEAKIKKLTDAYNQGVKESAELKAKYEDQKRRLRDEIAKRLKDHQS